MQYIPQAAPFVMIDSLVSNEGTATITTLTVRPDNILVDEDGRFSESGLIENMAQTAAAGTGYRAATDNTPPPVGFIGQIKNLSVTTLPKIGEMITTKVDTKVQVLNALIVQGTVKLNEKMIAEAEFKIFLQQ